MDVVFHKSFLLLSRGFFTADDSKHAKNARVRLFLSLFLLRETLLDLGFSIVIDIHFIAIPVQRLFSLINKEP